MTIESFYGDWRLYNDLIVEALRGMSADELALRAAPEEHVPANLDSSMSWPIWAIAGHTASTRVYWFCNFLGLPGWETTPFWGVEDGWEDHLDQPRSSEELVAAWTTTWAIIEGVLRTWTPEMLDEPMSPEGEKAAAHLTRRSLIHRMMFHEAFHAGEIAVIQGIHGRPQIDLWPPGYHTVEAAAARKSGT
jgi:hypothetical protein